MFAELKTNHRACLASVRRSLERAGAGCMVAPRAPAARWAKKTDGTSTGAAPELSKRSAALRSRKANVCKPSAGRTSRSDMTQSSLGYARWQRGRTNEKAQATQNQTFRSKHHSANVSPEVGREYRDIAEQTLATATRIKGSANEH